MAPYEALYGRPWRSLVCWTEVGERHLGEGGLDMEASSHGSEPVEELHRQTVTTSRV